MEAYQRDGYLLDRFADTPTHRALLNVLAEVRDEKLRPGFHFLNKWRRRDVKPRAWEYDPSVLGILHENKILDLVARVVGHPVSLVNVSIVESLPPGYYTNWHVDNFLPPVHKVIFYPRFGEPRAHRIDVLQGHVRTFRGDGSLRERIAVNKYVLEAEGQIARHRIRSVYSDDFDFLLVNTQALHRTCAVAPDQRELRILYSFRAPFRSVEDRKQYLSTAVGTLEDQFALEQAWHQSIIPPEPILPPSTRAGLVAAGAKEAV